MTISRGKFDSGTLVVDGANLANVPPQFEWDPRVEKYRAPAVVRRGAVSHLARQGAGVEDVSSAATSLKLKR